MSRSLLDNSTRANIIQCNLNADILKKFNADFSGNVAKADNNWPELVQKNKK